MDSAASPANSRLFDNINPDRLSDEKSKTFHSMIAKLGNQSQARNIFNCELFVHEKATGKKWNDV